MGNIFTVRDPIPDVPIPLQPGEAEPLLRLNQILHDLYDRAGYDLAVDYQRPPDPPLADADARWVEGVLQESSVWETWFLKKSCGRSHPTKLGVRLFQIRCCVPQQPLAEKSRKGQSWCQSRSTGLGSCPCIGKGHIVYFFIRGPLRAGDQSGCDSASATPPAADAPRTQNT